MTQDYKDNVLQYATGILEQQTGINEPQFEDILANQNDLKTNLSQYFSSMVVYTAFVPSKSVQNNDLGYSVLACYGTLVGQSDESGALVILDENYDIVKFMPTYSDGVLMGVIKCLNVDNQGNFYGIEYSNNSYKIIALNNIVLKRANQSDYEAVQTVVMTIPNQYTWDDMIKIQRDDTGNRYFVLGRRDVSGTTSLVGINVEISDQVTWQFFTTTYDMQPVFGIFNQGFNVYWDSNNALHYSIAVDNSGLVLLTEQNSNVMKATRYSNEPVPSSYSNFVFRTNEIGYYATVLDMDTYTEFKIYQINLLTNQVTQIYGEDTTYDSRNQLWFFKNNNDIMYYQVVKTNNANEYELNAGLIDDLTIYSTQLGTFTATSVFEAFCYANIINKFNQNYVYIQNQNTVFTFNFIWNDNNYNGTEFTSNSSLIPNYITIEDENEIMLFNRNLYNLVTYSNRYVATGVIPNYSLNQNIDTALLYSKNNNLLSSKYIDITKNIYEQVNINFINTFRILDNGNINIQASSKLVNSMINNDNEAYIGKIRINYEDETTSIKPLPNKDFSINNSIVTLFFVIYVDKAINSIDLISYDETTIYKTINGTSLETNKYYKITQDVRIE